MLLSIPLLTEIQIEGVRLQKCILLLFTSFKTLLSSGAVCKLFESVYVRDDWNKRNDLHTMHHLRSLWSPVWKIPIIFSLGVGQQQRWSLEIKYCSGHPVVQLCAAVPIDLPFCLLNLLLKSQSRADCRHSWFVRFQATLWRYIHHLGLSKYLYSPHTLGDCVR